ncbi:MAG: hypothetical protein MZW92_63800 [Comamonadaceae bacterium]|nr:hypothetical protein [Comamonadaceae bacterium]
MPIPDPRGPPPWPRAEELQHPGGRPAAPARGAGAARPPPAGRGPGAPPGDAAPRPGGERWCTSSTWPSCSASSTRLHPADIAYILEALPLDERLFVWDLVKAERDGEILLEVSDAVREIADRGDGHRGAGRRRRDRSTPTRSPTSRPTCRRRSSQDVFQSLDRRGARAAARGDVLSGGHGRRADGLRRW